MKKPYIENTQRGMTLIEIMVAMTLGAFLMAGVMQIFLSSKQSYRMQESMSRLQENGRFAMEFISRAIRTADYRACFSDASLAGAIFAPDDVTGSPDRISVIKKDNDCGTADSFTAVSFFIQNANGQPALHRVTQPGAATIPTDAEVNAAVAAATASDALIEGIENMQILYGEDTDADGSPNYYVDAVTVGDMGKVVSARITLTARTADNNLTSTGDGRLRRTFSSTIVLRNRL